MQRVRTREWSATDYYGVLGVPTDARPVEIDTRYRALAKSLHPDRTDDPEAVERFKAVGTAYRVLRDPATRLAYDDYRARIAAGTLYEPGSPWQPPPAGGVRVDHFAPSRPRRHRRTLPAGLRTAIAVALIVLGTVAAAWAALGSLPAPAEADTEGAVQITLLIMAIKLWACGAIVAAYPALRARWHR